MDNDRRIYLILCDDRYEYQKILDKYKIYGDCEIVLKDISRKRFYNKVKNLRKIKCEVTYKEGIKVIPDLWLWCNDYEINQSFNKEKQLLHELYDEIRWKEYNSKLYNIVYKYYKDEIMIKYEMMKVYKLVRKLRDLKLGIPYILRLIEFLFEERNNQREYNIYEAIHIFEKMNDCLYNNFTKSSNKMLIKNKIAYEKLAN